MILCVSDTGHAQVEEITAACCIPRPFCDGGISGEVEDVCMDCNNMPLQTASACYPSRRLMPDDAIILDTTPEGEPLCPPAIDESSFAAELSAAFSIRHRL